ncbi:hypothetical protein F4818DRAFT_440162 [Hypoxylon cercidicola]|nr:hypothetical protein F4818DRAFT_440162 [Hypoxylon cercidicola]
MILNSSKVIPEERSTFRNLPQDIFDHRQPHRFGLVPTLSIISTKLKVDSDTMVLIYNVSTKMNDPDKSASSKAPVRANSDSPESAVDLSRLLEKDDHELSEEARDLIIKLKSIMILTSLTNTEERAEHFIKEEVDIIDRLYMDQGYYFECEFCGPIFEIASHITPRNSLHDVLVKILGLLAADKRKYLDVLGELTKWTWISQFEDDDGLGFTDSQWLNLNSFLAKLYSEQVINWQPFPIWELRDGLEYPMSDPSHKSVPGTRIRVAAEWIVQSAPRLLSMSLLDFPSGHAGEEKRRHLYRGAPLYPDANGFSLERWCFWKRRFREMRTEVKEDLYEILDDAVETMTQAEKALGELAEHHSNASDFAKLEKDKENEKGTEQKDTDVNCEIHAGKENDVDIEGTVE